MQAWRFEMVYALCDMGTIQCFARFQFDGDRSLEDQAGDILPDDSVVAVNRDALLLNSRDPCLTQFVGQGILAHAL